MEDAHLAIPILKEVSDVLSTDVALYGVFDGHGGPAVSEWIARHMSKVLVETVEQVRKSGEWKEKAGNAEEIPEEVFILCEAMQRCFLQLDEEMQSKENRDEIRIIHDQKTAQSNDTEESQGEGGQSIRGLLSGQPRTLLQALLGAGAGPGGAGKPLVKFIEQDGEQYVQITSAPNEDEDMRDPAARDTAGDLTIREVTPDVEPTPAKESEATTEKETAKTEAEEAGKSDSDATEPEKHVENIVEDSHVTAPEIKSPAFQSAAAEALEKAMDLEPATASSDEESEPEEAKKWSEIPAEDEELSFPSGGPENCGAAVVVAALVGGSRPCLITANAGDSRVVLCRNGKAIPMSEDHKPSNAGEYARILHAGGRVVGGRVDGNLNLSRTLGDLFYKKNKNLKPQEQKVSYVEMLYVLQSA